MNEKEIDESTCRRIIAFSVDSEFVAAEFELKDVTLEDLRNQFGFQESDPCLLDAYRIEQKHQTWIKLHSEQKLDFNKYRYFLDYYVK